VIRFMDRNWSISFEHEEYEKNVVLIVKDAMEAVRNTAEGYYVNIVTPEGFGNPENYLTDILQDHFKDRIKTRFIDQCGCGGYVLRVWKEN